MWASWIGHFFICIQHSHHSQQNYQPLLPSSNFWYHIVVKTLNLILIKIRECALTRTNTMQVQFLRQLPIAVNLTLTASQETAGGLGLTRVGFFDYMRQLNSPMSH